MAIVKSSRCVTKKARQSKEKPPSARTTTEVHGHNEAQPSASTTAKLDDERAKKIEELQQKLERLQSMIESLTEEVKEKAIEDAGASNMDPICNTCLERKKGAALFPCGHTFCWKCTSELRRGPGRCRCCNQNFWNVIGVGPSLP